MKERSNALVIGYRGHQIAEHVKSLEFLRKKGLVGRINVLASRISQDAIVSSSNYPVQVNYDSEIQRDYAESGSENPERFSKYCEDIKDVILQTNSNLVLPTTDRAVIATANVFNKENYGGVVLTSSPSLPIVNLFQDKASTYRFFYEQNLFKTPSYQVINSSDLDNLNDDKLLTKFIAPYFAKPVCPQKGGSTGAREVSSIKQLRTLMDENLQYRDYIVTEFLNGPEINHTVIINPDGSVATQCTYEEIPNAGERQRVNICNDELNALGHRFGEKIKNSFESLDFRSVYNFDFLMNKSNELVLSEINPGRFPACMGVFNQGKYNSLEPLLLAIVGKSEKYPESYTIGKIFRNEVLDNLR
ncbi:hypothetical protein KAJ38_01465 [Candidatus Pacearchaeota archaeon]|nr:hypothetical protein [Candidatus Pacearchaeota archaeon]